MLRIGLKSEGYLVENADIRKMVEREIPGLDGKAEGVTGYESGKLSGKRISAGRNSGESARCGAEG
jgi:hypothetical protein